MDVKPDPVYPQAPPAYDESASAPQYPPQPQAVPVHFMAQQQQQPVYVVQHPAIIIQNVKIAPSFDSYNEMCPVCQKEVTTNVERIMGFCSWTMLFLGIFVFFPLLCCFCLDGFKDSRHSCPTCRTILSVKRR